MPDSDMSAVAQQAHEEALKRIGDCGRRRGTVLSLSDLGLTRLPPRITQLAKLTELDLSNNTLEALPPEIGQLANLTRLDLSHNPLRSLPPELGQLTHLALLYLSNNRLGSLPPELGRLANLTRLDLSHNPLRSLPPELGQLTKLTRLDLSHNQLDRLPPELGRLANLTRLFLSHNQLDTLLPELGQLANLTRLYLAHNRLGSLPPELGQLARLTVLDLSNNLLGALPPELGELANLAELDLDHNLLSSLPPELGQLAKLTVLRLMANQLASLPDTLLALESLEKLLVHDNPGLQLSPSVSGPDPRKVPDARVALPASILEFYFGRQSGKTRPLNEVKLILLGRDGVGKTSLAQALRDLPFREREVSTAGLAFGDWTLAGGAGEPVTVHVWDFAGQAITHALHPFFFSSRSMYVVVLTGREHHESDDADYWLGLIRAFGTEPHGDGPPVLVALNQWNVPGCRPEVDRGTLRERYPFIRGFVEIDCKVKKGIPVLKAALSRELERMPWVREPFPEEWEAVRHALAAGGMQREHLSYSEYQALCLAHGVKDEGQQDYLSEILHHLGAALHYRHDPRLRPAGVLQPEWLTRHAYALLRRAGKLAGLLKQADVDAVLQSDENARACLMQIMECFEVAFPLSSAAGGAWLVPTALPAAPPAGLEAFRDAEHAIRLRFTYPVWPDRLIVRIIVRRYDFVEALGEQKWLWRDGLVLARKGARVLIRTAAQDRQVLLTVLGPTKARHQLADLCQAELHDLHAEIPDLQVFAETQVQGAWVPIAPPAPAGPEPAQEVPPSRL
ncbi:MAG: leucine-rich repeat domain-containing protein [Verrucomicrobia bacterium]|nr:leucine-rich repeat domain-containing protein [Verrucomicrobiota bacterium]